MAIEFQEEFWFGFGQLRCAHPLSSLCSPQCFDKTKQYPKLPGNQVEKGKKREQADGIKCGQRALIIDTELMSRALSNCRVQLNRFLSKPPSFPRSRCPVLQERLGRGGWRAAPGPLLPERIPDHHTWSWRQGWIFPRLRSSVMFLRCWSHLGTPSLLPAPCRISPRS